MAKNLLIPDESIERAILLIRSQKVMLDRDLAGLYQVPTSRLNEAVKRNHKRFPEDFMFQLTVEEFLSLTCKLRYQTAAAVAELSPTPSPSMVSRCSPRS